MKKKKKLKNIKTTHNEKEKGKHYLNLNCFCETRRKNHWKENQYVRRDLNNIDLYLAC